TADTWVWDGALWSRHATTGPSARQGHTMAYDAARRRVVLFGGLRPDNSYLADTWAWDGSTWTQGPWGPPARAFAAAALHAVRQRVVLFGGGLGLTGAYLSDTWEWDGSAWTSRPTAAMPAARQGHAMAYDLARQRTVLFGGTAVIILPTPMSDTW